MAKSSDVGLILKPIISCNLLFHSNLVAKSSVCRITWFQSWQLWQHAQHIISKCCLADLGRRDWSNPAPFSCSQYPQTHLHVRTLYTSMQAQTPSHRNLNVPQKYVSLACVTCAVLITCTSNWCYYSFLSFIQNMLELLEEMPSGVPSSKVRYVVTDSLVALFLGCNGTVCSNYTWIRL